MCVLAFCTKMKSTDFSNNFNVSYPICECNLFRRGDLFLLTPFMWHSLEYRLWASMKFRKTNLKSTDLNTTFSRNMSLLIKPIHHCVYAHIACVI